MMPNQLVRMRIVNAGSRADDYKEFYLEGHDVFLAAIDGINLVSLPRSSSAGKSFAGFVAYNKDNRLLLAPGNRADVYFIAKDIGRHALVMHRTPRFGAPSEGTQDLMTFEVSQSDFSNQPNSVETYDSELARFLHALDANLNRLQGVGAYAKGGYLYDITKEKVDAERTVVFDVQQARGRPFYVNRRSYNGEGGGHADHTSMPGATDYLGSRIGDGGKGPQGQDPWPIRRGTVEKWTIKNISNSERHSFHIHVNPFWVVAIRTKDGPVPAGDPRLGRWQDTVDLPPGGEVTVLHRFQDYEGLFVLHCHILQHEDRGMMINVLIVPTIDTNPKYYFEKQVAENQRLNDQINH